MNNELLDFKIPGINYLSNQKSIYHYTNCGALKNIIEKNEFWVTHASFLNDSSEVLYIKKIIKDMCYDLSESEEFSNELYERIIDEYEVYENSRELFIISFSTNPDSLTLWSEFSNFNGYNMEFNIMDFRKYLKTSDKIRESSYDFIEGKVLYEYKKQKALIKGLFDECFNSANEIQRKYNHSTINLNELCSSSVNPPNKTNAIQEFFLSFSIRLVFYSPFLKSSNFKDEEEYRFVFKYNNGEKRTEFPEEINFREREGIIIPYIKLQLSKNKDKLPVKSILVGAKNNCDLAVTGTKYFLKQNGYSCEDVDVKRSYITLRY